MTLAVHCEGLAKRYGSVRALKSLDLEVPEGTVLGLLGPNGAGKTTAVRILSTLLSPDGGRVRVTGLDVVTQARQVRRAIGLSGQYAAVDEDLTGFENLDMVARLYGLGRRRSRERAHELLARFDLEEAGGRVVKGYSGGMRRRLDLAGALIGDPKVLFLDEPTTGLDPRSRLGMWEVLEELVAAGCTLLLTTQYLEEADRLADDIVVIDHGEAIARGTADELKLRIGGERIELTVASREELGAARTRLCGLAVGEVVVDVRARTLTVPVTGGRATLSEALRLLDALEVTDIGLRRPTLDDVFLVLTGHGTADDDKDDE